MQVGLNPVNMNSPRATGDTSFGSKINMAHSVMCPDTFSTLMNKGVHEDSPENRTLLGLVVHKLKNRCDAKWSLPDIKEAAFKAWGQDDKLKEMFKGY